MSPATPGHPSTSRSGADVPRTVLFDLYGTLVEPDWPVLLDRRSALAERVGVSGAAAHRAWDATHPRRMTGGYGSLADDLAAVIADASDGRRIRLSATQLAELADEERDNWRHGVRLYPDAVPALSRLRASGLRIAIVTNASAEALSVVDALGLRALVHGVFASCEARAVKPELLGIALRQLGAEASETSLVDDEPAQLDGAGRLGIDPILVQRSGVEASASTANGRHPLVTDLRDVADLVRRAEPAPRR
jgi:putative hydrolase of the HAD superfamily